MAGYTSSLRESVSHLDSFVAAQQGRRRLNSNGGAPWPGTQAGSVGTTETHQQNTVGGDNAETQALFDVPAPGSLYGENDQNPPEDTSVTHQEQKRFQEYSAGSSPKSNKGSKKGSKKGESSKGSKKSSKAGSGEGSKGNKSSKSQGIEGSTQEDYTSVQFSAGSTRGEGIVASTHPPTASPRAREHTKTEKPTGGRGNHTAHNSNAKDEHQGSSTPRPTPAPSPPVNDDLDRMSDFPSQAPTCKECDDIGAFTALNKVGSDQDQPVTRRNLALVVAALGVGMGAALWAILVLVKSWRQHAKHSRIEAIHDDNPANDSKFSDSDVTVVVFEDDNDDEDEVEEDEALEA